MPEWISSLLHRLFRDWRPAARSPAVKEQKWRRTVPKAGYSNSSLALGTTFSLQVRAMTLQYIGHPLLESKTQLALPILQNRR